MEQNSDFPKAAIPGILTLEVPAPFRIGTQKIDARVNCRPRIADCHCRRKKRLCYGGATNPEAS
jgi:hypothetical protein